MCVLATPRTRRATNKSWAKPSEITFGVSHESATSFPSVADANVFSMFWDGTTCRTLVHKLGRE
jgi:hypothetical protein